VQLPRRSDSGQLLASANGQGQVTNLGLTDESGNNPENLPLQVHPLHSSWVFWFMHRPPGQKLVDYEGAMKRISAFSSVSLIFI
jgi:translation initiation factor 4E